MLDTKTDRKSKINHKKGVNMAEKETKKPFRTILDPPKKTVTPAGKKIIEELAMRINEKGEEEFYVKGKTNIWEKTQAFLEETKIENILRAVTETGDMNYLNRIQGTYADISEYPGNIFEAQKKIKAAEETFHTLPLEIRAKYENNFNKFLADFGTENWIKNMNIKEETKETVKEETKANES